MCEDSRFSCRGWSGLCVGRVGQRGAHRIAGEGRTRDKDWVRRARSPVIERDVRRDGETCGRPTRQTRHASVTPHSDLRSRYVTGRVGDGDMVLSVTCAMRDTRVD
jgi:hypothetical protein